MLLFLVIVSYVGNSIMLYCLIITLSNSIKKRTYQIVYRADIGDDLNEKWYTDKVVIK